MMGATSAFRELRFPLKGQVKPRNFTDQLAKSFRQRKTNCLNSVSQVSQSPQGPPRGRNLLSGAEETCWDPPLEAGVGGRDLAVGSWGCWNGSRGANNKGVSLGGWKRRKDQDWGVWETEGEVVGSGHSLYLLHFLESQSANSYCISLHCRRDDTVSSPDSAGLGLVLLPQGPQRQPCSWAGEQLPRAAGAHIPVRPPGTLAWAREPPATRLGYCAATEAAPRPPSPGRRQRVYEANVFRFCI